MEKKKNFEIIEAVSAPLARPEILLVKNGEDVKIAGLAAKIRIHVNALQDLT